MGIHRKGILERILWVLISSSFSLGVMVRGMQKVWVVFKAVEVVKVKVVVVGVGLSMRVDLCLVI